jgi:protein SCO1
LPRACDGRCPEPSMTARNLRLVIIAAAFLAGLVVCLGAIVTLSGLSSSSVTQHITSIGGSFRLVDQDGRPVSDTDLRGHPFLVFFGFTNCPDICPTTLFEVSEVLRALGPDAGGMRAFFITIDPERDTPPVLKDYLSNFDPHLSGLTGVPLEQGDYTMDHTAVVYLMDKNGRFVSPFNLKRTAQAAAADLRRYL